MNRQQERRRFLRAVGATALTLPFVKALPSYAATGDPPVYLVLLFTPSGFVQHLWGAVAPKPTGTTPSIASPLVFRPTLSVFDTMGLTDKVTVLDGLNVGAASGTSHEPGMGALWTGVSNAGNPSTTPSIDQVIADQLNAGRPFKTIDLMVRSTQDWTSREVKTRMSYNATGGYVDPLDSPITARNTLFPGAASMGTSGPDKKTFIRNKLFNQFNTELTGLQGKLCNEDRTQLQAMQQAWHDLNQQLASAAMAAASCTTPGAPPSTYRPLSADSFPTSAKLQMDILAMSLACDLTRVASLQFSTATSQVTHTWLGSNQTQVHHDYSHQGPSSMYALGTDIYSASAANQYGALAQLSAIDAWYAQQVAYLASQLKMFSVGGKNLLDQTVICWGSEVALGAAHNHNAAPFILVGGGGGRLKTNQVVRFPMRVPADTSTANIVDRAHNDLLITLAQVMGVNMTTFGGTQFHQDGNDASQPASTSTGPIREILAT
jgi:hypothetical protein